jgi:uncharacterized protein YigE (DUF2233 family)
MNTPLSLVLLLSLLFAAGAQAEYKRIDISVSEKGSKGTLHLYLFDSNRAALKIIDQGSVEKPTYKNLEHAMKAHQCLAGCNGGFFGKDGQPLGLVFADGKQSGKKNLASSLTSGVLGQGTGKPFIQRAAAYFGKGAQSHQQVLQSGPLLVENGKIVSGLSNKRHARRTVVLTDGGRKWAIAYSPAITLAQFAKALADPKSFPDFNVQQALNLDGGSSSGLWIRRDNHPFYLREINTVRNFVGIVRK